MTATYPRASRLHALLGAAVAMTLASVGLVTPSAAESPSIVADGFDRSTASGWGVAPAGGQWSVTGGASTATHDGNGFVNAIQPGRSFFAYLPDAPFDSGWGQATFYVPKTSNFYYSVELRRQQNLDGYRGRARIDSTGVLHVEIMRRQHGHDTMLAQKAVGSVLPGDAVTVRLSVVGSSPVKLDAKAYRTNTAVPSWQVSTQDGAGDRLTAAGAFGVSAYVGSSGPATSVRTEAITAASVGGSTPSPTPPPVVAPPPVVPAPPVASPPPVTGPHGALPIGSTSYPVPNGAIFVAPSGNDDASGTQASPLATVTKALTKVRSRGSIVIRGGTYHEYFIVPPGKDVTIQSYPKEPVWFDGSSIVTGFTFTGSAWRVSNWTTQFDSSPTYTKGAPDGTAPGWQFVNPDHPMAAHPDGVWIDGVEQQQVQSLGQVKSGTFYVDYTSKSLYIGTNPSGKSIRASTLAQAVSLRAPGTLIRGVGFRRYADSVWQQGVITSYSANMHLENVEVDDSATGGIGFYGISSSLRNVTVLRSGQIAIQASYADGLILDNVLVRDSNSQFFNPAPSAGGIKITTTRGLLMRNSVITNTNGNQFWTDQSVFDITLVHNTITDGARYGVVIEISSLATIVDNIISRNRRDGIFIQDSDRVNVWNNTLMGNGRHALAVLQDERRITNLSVPGHDRRRPQPDLSMPWVISRTTVGNNIYGGVTGSDPLVNIQDYKRVVGANSMMASSDGNIFYQPTADAPRFLLGWGYVNSPASYFDTLPDFVHRTGLDRDSRHIIGVSPVDSLFHITPAIQQLQAAVAQPLPVSVAAIAGVAAGTKRLGAW